MCAPVVTLMPTVEDVKAVLMCMVDATGFTSVRYFPRGYISDSSWSQINIILFELCRSYDVWRVMI